MRFKMADVEMKAESGEAVRIAFARPHFGMRDDHLYFFLSKRPFHYLTSSELKLWKGLEAAPVPLNSGADEQSAEALAKAGVVEIIAPVRAGSRRRVLVVEPHCDDAALSIGATMWKMREEAEFHLLTMASRSNYTTAFQLHRDHFDRSHITAMRTAEGELFMRHLAGQYYCAGLAEATLRYKDEDWDLKFFEDHEVAAAISNNRRAPEAVLCEWVGKLQTFLRDRVFDEIWFPLGAGTHSDHDLARNAGLRVLLEDRPAATVRLYEDVPYGAEFPKHRDRILKLLESEGATLKPYPQDVTAEFSAKLSLLKIFASQFKVGAIQEGVERSASVANDGRKVERLWTLEALPKRLPEDQLWIGAPDVREISASLSAFRRGASSETRVAIFAINASGRWRDDLSLLCEVFPSAKFVIYAGPRVRSEFHEVRDRRVDLKSLDGRSMAWLKAAWREFATGHRIVIAGQAVAKAKALRIFWPLGQTIVVPAMDRLFQGLASFAPPVQLSDRG